MNTIYSQFNTSQLRLIGHENFAVWQLAMEALLSMKGWLGCIIGDPSQVQDPYADSQARQLIIDSIESTNYIHVMHTKTAREAWNKLQDIFGGSGLSRKVGFLKSMSPTQLTDFPTMEQYIDYTITVSLKVRTMGIEMSDECIGMQLLAGLTNDYWKLIVELDRTKAKITTDFVKALLLKDTTKNHCLVPNSYENSSFPINGQLKYEKNEINASANMRQANPMENHCFDYSTSMTKDFFHDNHGNSLEASSTQPRESSTSGCSSLSFLPTSNVTPTKEDLEVEALGGHGGYYEGHVSDVYDDSVDVTFEGGSTVNFSFVDVRLSSRNTTKPEIRKSEEIDVYTRINDTHPWGWWRATIDKVVGNGHVIVEIPRWLGSRFGHNECVSIDRIRSPNRNGSIDEGTFYKREILVPVEQRDSANHENAHKEFQKAVGAASCRYVPDRGVLLLISRNDNLKTLGSWIDEKHFGEHSGHQGCYGQTNFMDNCEPRLYTLF